MDNYVIPHGYKATALGIIPQEWEVMLLGNLSNSISSGEINTEMRTVNIRFWFYWNNWLFIHLRI